MDKKMIKWIYCEASDALYPLELEKKTLPQIIKAIEELQNLVSQVQKNVKKRRKRFSPPKV